MAPSPSLKYLVRILGVLLSQDEVTITNLAMMSRTNHQRCRELIRWMQTSGYAQTRLHHNKRYVSLTESGYRYAKRLLELSSMTRLMNRVKADTYLQDSNEIH